MKIPKSLAQDEDIDEEDYEEAAVVVEEALCRVLMFILLDNNYFSILIDENVDKLASLRSNLNPVRRETLKNLNNSRNLEAQNFKFSYFVNEKLEILSSEAEYLTIKELIENYQLKSLVADEKLVFYLYKEENSDIEHPPDPNELFREYVKVTYSILQNSSNKILVGKAVPKPSVLILNTAGEEQDHIKLKDVVYKLSNEKVVDFSSKSG